MKLKMKLMAAAIALVAASGAQADIATSVATGASGSAELFLAIWDPVAEKSYFRDLGIKMNDFMPTLGTGANALDKTNLVPQTNLLTVGGQLARPMAGSFAVGATMSYQAGSVLTPGYSLTFNADSSAASFFDGNLTGKKWMVGAVDTTGDGVKNADRLLTTSLSNVAGITTGNLVMANITADGYLAAQNTKTPGTLTADNGTATHLKAEGSGYFDNLAMANWGNKTAFLNTADVGQSQNFWFLGTGGTGATAENASVIGFTGATWTLQSNGDLVYAAVPEPSEYALMLAGLGMLGFMARRRLNNRA